MKSVGKWTLLLLITLLVLQPSVAMGQFFFMQNPLEGKQAPEFRLLTLSGKKQGMTQFRDGKEAVIFFWATWCPHCRDQLDELNKYKMQIEKKNVKLILVDVGESPHQVSAYMKRNKIDFDVFLDQESNVSDEYGLIGVPTFFFVDKDGMVSSVVHYLPEDFIKSLENI